MKKIAIIGAGISGLGAAYLLKDHFDVTLYEKNDYFGGHARTIVIDNQLAIDTGFIVFNDKTYPNFSGLLRHLGVSVAKSDMSFGVSIDNGAFEYGSKRMMSLFSQPKNLISYDFWRMLSDIVKFNTLSKKHIKKNSLHVNLSLQEYVCSLNLGRWFVDYYLIPMGAAIWSTPLEQMYAFPATTFIHFFNNHGLLDIHRPIQWYTIEEGSQSYVKKLIDSLKQAKVTFKGEAKKVSRQEKIYISDDLTNYQCYDVIIFATHSDQALALLESPSDEEREILGAISYHKNKAILHKDPTFMPKRKSAWSSWVYLSSLSRQKEISLTYWMNNLQPLKTKDNYFVTLNPERRPDNHLIIDEYVFEHPLLNKKAIEAQQKFETIQGMMNSYYCGAYSRYGFHEDGLLSAVNVARALGVSTPW